MNEKYIWVVAIPIFIFSILFEAWWIHRRQAAKNPNHQGYEVRDTFASLSMGVGYLILASLFKLILLPAYMWASQYSFFQIGDSWLAWVALFLAQDFCFYWYHRTHHGVRMLWASHVNHHSSEHYNLSTALRQSWTQMFTSIPFFFPLIMIGFSPKMLVIVEIFSLLYQYWIHTEAIGTMGWFEKVFNTPSHHRVHHGSNNEYLDRNHAGILIIWDRMFGTFQAEDNQVVYGITTNIKTFNPVRIAFHEWVAMFRDVARASNFRQALAYVFLPPGWTPTAKSGPEADVRKSVASQELSC